MEIIALEKRWGSEMESPILQTKELTKSFEASVPVLKDISFSINRGEVVVVVGPSGCGKSTFLRCLNLLENIDSGEILLDGKAISSDRKKFHKYREKIGMVFQSYDLFPHKTVLENVIMAPVLVQKRKKEEVKQEAEKLLERVGLLEKKEMYPRQLSGGQKQRAAIVRSLIMHPEILLLDEITAALDPEMVREVLQVVLELAREGMTMIIVTHEMEFAKAVADRVIFLDHGEIVEEEIPQEFFAYPKTERAKKFLNTFHFEAMEI